MRAFDTRFVLYKNACAFWLFFYSIFSEYSVVGNHCLVVVVFFLNLLIFLLLFFFIFNFCDLIKNKVYHRNYVKLFKELVVVAVFFVYVCLFLFLNFIFLFNSIPIASNLFMLLLFFYSRFVLLGFVVIWISISLIIHVYYASIVDLIAWKSEI